jgi:hypothetical protein
LVNKPGLGLDDKSTTWDPSTSALPTVKPPHQKAKGFVPPNHVPEKQGLLFYLFSLKLSDLGRDQEAGDITISAVAAATGAGMVTLHLFPRKSLRM